VACSSSGDQAHVTHHEYVVIDRAGRLQVPQEYLRALGIDDRAVLRLEEDRIVLEAVATEPKERDKMATAPSATDVVAMEKPVTGHAVTEAVATEKVRDS